MRRRCSARCCSRTCRNTASSRAARAGSPARRLLHGAECRGRGPRRRRATASRIESVLPYSRQHAAKHGGMPRLRRRAALAATLLAAPARPSRFRLSSLCTPGAARGATALAFARFGFRGPAGPALLSRALRGRLAPRPGALASRPWLCPLKPPRPLPLSLHPFRGPAPPPGRSARLSPPPLCGVLRVVPRALSAAVAAVLTLLLHCR